jgi:hypothetical protein
MQNKTTLFLPHGLHLRESPMMDLPCRPLLLKQLQLMTPLFLGLLLEGRRENPIRRAKAEMIGHD